METTNRNYKDTLFRMIFREKKELLSLYNALNGTVYDNPEELEINTLENAVYMNLKNDISFIFAFFMNLYEHQASFNPNMPLRYLFYVVRLYEKFIADKTLYSSALVKIPTPRFVVFYNGLKNQPERSVLKLSDAFQNSVDQPELELTVTMLNINIGHNKELMEQCKTLHDYMLYVEKVRTYAKKMEPHQAVERAVNECIAEGILQDFLVRCKAEVVQVSIFEYDEEKEIEKIRRAEHEYGFEEGQTQGISQGISQGITQGIVSLIRVKTDRGLDLPTIAAFMEIDEVYVKKVLDLIAEDPYRTDEQIATRLVP